MTKGQRAMAVAMICPDPAALKRKGSSSTETVEQAGVSAQRISYARTVLRWASELAPQVLAGAETLDKAYATASDRKVAAEAPG